VNPAVLHERIRIGSLAQAAAQQGLSPLLPQLKAAVPDISDQYTHRELGTPYITAKVRTQHAFQMSLLLEALQKAEWIVEVLKRLE
jgi:hypothetical protein